MNKSEIAERIKGLNEFMLSNSDKKLLLLTISNVYTYNKAVALVDKENDSKNWYEIDNKNCFKNWNEVEAFLEGLCLGKNTNFKSKKQILDEEIEKLDKLYKRGIISEQEREEALNDR